MFRKILITLILIILINTAKAQSGKHTVGIQAGSYSRKVLLMTNSLGGSGLEFGPGAGLFYRYRFSSRISVDAGLSFGKEFDKRLYNFNVNQDAPDTPPFRMRHNFVNVPIHLVIQLNKKEEGAWKFNLLLGSLVQRYLSSKIIYPDNAPGYTNETVHFRIPNWDLYADAAIEVEYAFSQKYKMGFSPGYRYQIFDAYRDKGFFCMLKFGRSF